MKTIDYYMSLPYKLEIVPDEEGGYVARYPELPGCIADPLSKFSPIKHPIRHIHYLKLLRTK